MPEPLALTPEPGGQTAEGRGDREAEPPVGTEEPIAGLPAPVVAALARLDELVEWLEQHPDLAVQEPVSELLQCVDVLHRAGLRRIADRLGREGLLESALEAPEIRLLFDLYHLVGDGERARVTAVLAEAQRLIEPHGANVELLRAEPGLVRLRLTTVSPGSGCSASELRAVVEQTVRDGLPELERLEIVEAPPPAPLAFIPRASIGRRVPPPLTWHTALRVEDVAEDALRGVEVAGERVLVANVAGDVYAFRNACPGSPLPLDRAEVVAGTLHCPWHGCRFDLRSGGRLGRTGPGLDVLPVAVADGAVRVGLRT
ncbi:MAG: Rieske 2Fe-2S domain-containing protein [Chloroflexi bacterium]|nr:Rieske 2Fe-2S domain-containing protein [Chloroflexota bacterium]